MIYHLEVSILRGTVEASINHFPVYSVTSIETGNIFSMPINPYLIHVNNVIGKILPVNKAQLTSQDPKLLPEYTAKIKEFEAGQYSGHDQGRVIAETKQKGFIPFNFSFNNKSNINFGGLFDSFEKISSQDALREFGFQLYKTVRAHNIDRLLALLDIKLKGFSQSFSFTLDDAKNGIREALNDGVIDAFVQAPELFAQQIVAVDCWDKKLFLLMRANGKHLLSTSDWEMPIFVAQIDRKLFIVR